MLQELGEVYAVEILHDALQILKYREEQILTEEHIKLVLQIYEQ
jgi:hypothetical protein